MAVAANRAADLNTGWTGVMGQGPKLPLLRPWVVVVVVVVVLPPFPGGVGSRRSAPMDPAKALNTELVQCLKISDTHSPHPTPIPCAAQLPRTQASSPSRGRGYFQPRDQQGLLVHYNSGR